jgi:hypothetical protein
MRQSVRSKILSRRRRKGVLPEEAAHGSAGCQPAVSQVANLRVVESALAVRKSADWQSAIQQAGSLRYIVG